MDTVRRVNSDEPMTTEELQQARAVLDRHIKSGKVDVREARRRVGAMLAEVEPTAAPTAPPRTVGERQVAAAPSKSISSGAGIVGVVLVLLVGGCWVLVDRNTSSGDESGAIVYCHQFIEDRLKSPASADFPSNSEHQVTELGTQSWRVVSYVDAENSFGASLRTDWTCEISYDEPSETWTLESLTGL